MLFITADSPFVYLEKTEGDRDPRLLLPSALSLSVLSFFFFFAFFFCLKRFVNGLQKFPTTALHCTFWQITTPLYKLERNAAKLRPSCLPEVMVSYIFCGLLCKTFPLGSITFGKIKNVCLLGGQASAYSHRRLSELCVLLGLAENTVRIHVCSRNHSQERKWSGLQTGRTVSSAIWMCAGEKTEGEKKGVVVNKREKSWTARDN